MSDNKSELSIATPKSELEERLLNENDLDELKNIIPLFNLNMKRKDLIRVGKLNDLQDKIVSQMSERLEKKAGEFNNRDLLDYFKVIQDTISNTDEIGENITTPQIQLNQNQLNINLNQPELTRESREKVTDAVKSILAKLQNDHIDVADFIEQSDNDEGDNT